MFFSDCALHSTFFQSVVGNRFIRTNSEPNIFSGTMSQETTDGILKTSVTWDDFENKLRLDSPFLNAILRK